MIINGTEILKETRIFTDISTNGKIVLLVLSIIAFLVCAFFVWYNYDYDEFDMCLWFFGAVISLAVIVGSICMLCSDPKPDRYEYVVLVKDQEVAAKEIYEKYDVININGNIWTIQGK